MSELMQVGYVKLVSETDSDLKVVNAARASFNKRSDWLVDDEKKYLKKEDVGLIGYLAKHKHWSPFTHCRLQFHLPYTFWTTFIQRATPYDLESCQWDFSPYSYHVIVNHSLYGWINFIKKLQSGFLNHCFDYRFVHDMVLEELYKSYPVSTEAYLGRYDHAEFMLSKIEYDRAYSLIEFREVSDEKKDWFAFHTLEEMVSIPVSRQEFKTKVSVAFNEVSRRYVSSDPTYQVIEKLRLRPESIKQGSSEEDFLPLDHPLYEKGNKLLEDAHGFYKELVDAKVCPEQSRFYLPQAMNTIFYRTAPLAVFKNYIEQRLDPHAQKEIRENALLVKEALGL